VYVAELKRRRYRGKRRLEVSNPRQAFQILRDRIEDWSREHFLVILLDARHCVQGVETISVGTLTASLVHPREVFKPAVAQSVAAILIGHNHPSGDPEPSPEDLELTKRLSDAGRLMGIDLIDHVIFGKQAYVSLKERSVL